MPYYCLGGFKAAPRLGEQRVGYLGRPPARKKLLPWFASYAEGY